VSKYDKIAEKFYKLIKSQKPLSPSLKNIAVHNAFRAMSLGDFTGSERDARHWQKDGFKNKAYPVHIGWFKYLFGAFTYSIVKISTNVIGLIYVKDNRLEKYLWINQKFFTAILASFICRQL
jgi:hypothetical protein